MKKFNSIEEIRKEIDKIDSRILELISDRKELVVEVVKLKSRNQIIDRKRIKTILEKLEIAAEKKKLPKGLVRSIWTLMIQGFIKYEENIFDEIHNKEDSKSSSDG
tara:strand:+ start:210 stop:527 length:318 start_codon:yes stop_codon:yes gene_type:complete